MKEKKIKDKRTTFRMEESDYNRICSDAAECGMDLSSYIRARVVYGMDRIFYDPSMTAALRAYREDIRSLIQEIERVRGRIDRDNFVQIDDLRQIKGLVKSIYRKMDAIEGAVGKYRKELMANGDYKAVEDKIRDSG